MHLKIGLEKPTAAQLADAKMGDTEGRASLCKSIVSLSCCDNRCVIGRPHSFVPGVEFLDHVKQIWLKVCLKRHGKKSSGHFSSAAFLLYQSILSFNQNAAFYVYFKKMTCQTFVSSNCRIVLFIHGFAVLEFSNSTLWKCLLKVTFSKRIYFLYSVWISHLYKPRNLSTNLKVVVYLH